MGAIPPPAKLTKEFLILGEGDRDVSLVNALVTNRNIRTSLQADLAGGQTGFQDRLIAYSGISGWNKLKGVLRYLHVGALQRPIPKHNSREWQDSHNGRMLRWRVVIRNSSQS